MSIEFKAQPISGVSAGSETILESTWPSIAATGFGRLIGTIMDSIPLRIGSIKVSYLLFGLLVAPFGLLAYFAAKIWGDRYEVTNRSVRVRSALGATMKRKVALTDFADVLIDVRPGQAYHHAGDLVFVDAKGEPVLRLAGVVRPERFRHVILKARTARIESDRALKTIEARAQG